MQNNYKNMLLVSLILSILGFLTFLNFESMAYWGNDTMVWFWVGAIFIYLCIFGAFFLIFKSNKNKDSNKVKVGIQLFIGSLSLYTLVWTSLVVYVWYLKDFSI